MPIPTKYLLSRVERRENGILFWANWANKAYLANKANKVFKANGQVNG